MITAGFTDKVRRFIADVAPDEVQRFDAELQSALQRATTAVPRFGRLCCFGRAGPCCGPIR